MFPISDSLQLSIYQPGAWDIQVVPTPLEMISETMHCVYELRGEKGKKSNLRKSEKEFGDQ